MKIHASRKSLHYKEALRIMQTPNGDVEEAKKLLFTALEENDPFAAYALGTWFFLDQTELGKILKKAFHYGIFLQMRKCLMHYLIWQFFMKKMPQKRI